jgi:hypothetical protein
VIRWIGLAAVALLIALLAGQLAIPPLVGSRIESRLTEGGGSADVSVSAFPAERLLFGDGKRITVTGNGLDLPLQESGAGVFDKLDGFDSVAVNLSDFRAGPFTISSFELTRASGSAPYHLVSSAATTPGDLAGYGASRLGLPGGPLLGFLGNQVSDGGTIPVKLDLGLTSDGGRVVVVSGGATVAGYPTGPLAELITSAIAVRL